MFGLAPNLEECVKTFVAVMTALVALTATACNRTAAADLSTPEARGSYAQGVELGQGGQGVPLDVEAFLAGVRAGLNGTSELDPQQRQQALMEFRTILMEAANAKGAEALAAGTEFLDENGRRDGVTTTASGVQYEVLRQGDGPRPTAADRVLVQYRGQTVDGTVFDESYSGGEPRSFGVTQVIPGLAEGLQLMPVGSHYKFYIPGPLGYGVSPPPGGQIGPNDVLVFEVELLRIE